MKKLLILSVLVLLAAPQLTFAKESENDAMIPPTNDRTEIMEKRAQAMRLSGTPGPRKELRDEMQEMREDLRPTIEARREEMKQNFEAKREEFKQKLATLKDEKKKTIAERIDTKLSAINQKRTDQMTETLKRLEDALTRIKTKADAAAASGKDVSSVNTAITAAQTAIQNAKAAVATQAGKDYTAQVTGDATLKNSMGTQLKQLQADLSTTHKTVVDAKKAVVAALTALLKVTGETMPTAVPTVPAATAVPTDTVSPVPSI